MFYDSTAFNDARQRSEVNPDAVFIINDIELVVPPTNIIVHKEDMYWNWKTLRTNISTKISSGQGFCQATVNIIFTPDLILHLHRLIVQIKNSPFCFIENEFLRDSIVPGWSKTKFMAFCVSSFFVNNVPGLPGTFRVQLDLKWFNYEPYTDNYLYKRDFLTYPIKEDGSKFQYTIPTIIGRDLETSHVPILISNEEAKSYYSDYATLSENNFREIIEDRKRNDAPRTILENFTGFIFDGMGLPNVIMPSVPSLPFHSNIYKRYINDLQIRSLYDNFNIDFYKEIQKYFGVVFSDNGEVSGRIDQEQSDNIHELLNHFTIGEKIIRKNSMSYRNVSSLHSATDRVKKGTHEVIQNIIKAMHSKHLSFELHYKEFKKLAVPPFLERIKSKIRKEQYLEELDLGKQSSRIIGRASASNLYNAYKDAGGGTKGFENSSDNTIVVNAEFEDVPVMVNGKQKVVDGKAVTKKQRKEGTGTDVKISGHSENAISLDDFLINKKGMIHPPVGNLKDRSLKPFVNSGFGWRTLRNEKGEITKDANHNGIDFTARKLGSPFTLQEIINILNEDPKAISISQESKDIIKRDLRELVDISTATSMSPDNARRRIVELYKDKLHPVFAVESGTIINKVNVVDARKKTGGGLQVWIQHNKSPDESFITSAYMHLSYTLKKIEYGAKVEKGEIIGFVGNSGKSFGDHLHFGIKSTVPGQYSNMWIPPYPLLVANFEQPEVKEPTTEEEKIEELKEGTQKAGMELSGDKEFKTLSEAEKRVLATYIAMQEDMVKAGWKPYLKDLNSNNTWERTGTLSLSSVMGVLDSYEAELDPMRTGTKTKRQSELEELKESIFLAYSSLNRDASLTNLESLKKELYDVHSSLKITQNLIVTGIGAGFSNIIASIPILDYEFPTTQHLGQMEPTYSFEIQMISDLDKPNGLPAEGRVLNRLFQTMQENARSFRQVPDGSNFNLDSFITRLMGSYMHRDLDLGTGGNQRDLLARFVLNRSSIETVEGSPGRSLMNLEITQSNPFYTEKIEAVNTVTETVEDTAYKHVLKKLYDLNFTDHGRQAFLLSLLDKGNNRIYKLNNIERLSLYDQGNLNNKELATFGDDYKGRIYTQQFIEDQAEIAASSLKYQIEQGNLEKLNGFTFDEEEIKSLLKEDSVARVFFEKAGVTYEEVTEDGEVTKSSLSYKDKDFFNDNVDPEKGVSHYVSEEALIDFYDRHPSYDSLKEGTGEATIGDVKDLYLELHKTLMSYRFCIAEPEAGGIHFDEISKTLYDVNFWTSNTERELCQESHYPSLWRNFIFWTVEYLRNNIGDEEPDSLDGGLGWTKDQLNNYLNSIEFQGLYTTRAEKDEAENVGTLAVKFFIANQQYDILTSRKSFNDVDILQKVKAAILRSNSQVFISQILGNNHFDTTRKEILEQGFSSFKEFKDEVMKAYFDAKHLDSDTHTIVNTSSDVIDSDPDDYPFGTSEVVSLGTSEIVYEQEFGTSDQEYLPSLDSFLNFLNFYMYIKRISDIKKYKEFFGEAVSDFLLEDLRSDFETWSQNFILEIENKGEVRRVTFKMDELLDKIEKKITFHAYYNFYKEPYGSRILNLDIPVGEAQLQLDPDSRNLQNEILENIRQIGGFANRFNNIQVLTPEQIVNEALSELARDLLESNLTGEEKAYYISSRDKKSRKIDFDRIHFRDKDLLERAFAKDESNNLEIEIYDALYTNSMGGWVVAAGGFLYDGVSQGNSTDAEDVALMATGETLSQLVAKATLFMISRTMIYTNYLDSLYTESLSVGTYDSAISTKFASLKPFAKLAFTKKKLLENGASGPMMAFSSLEVYLNGMIEWMLEPRLINNVGLDIRFGSAGGAGSEAEDVLLQSLGTFIGLQSAGGMDGPLDMEEIESISRTGKSFFQNKVGLAGGVLDAGAVGYYGYNAAGATTKAGALFAEGSAGGLLALVGLVPTLAVRTAGSLTGGDEVLEVGARSGEFDADSRNKMFVTNMLINPQNSATYSYYNQTASSRFGEVRDVEKLVASRSSLGIKDGNQFHSAEYETGKLLDPFTTDDVRTDPNVKKFLNLNQYVDLEIEKMKLEVIRGKLEAIVKTVLSSRDICYALDIKYAEATAQSFSRPKSFGDSCYPDINIPKHPFYQESNIEMSPDFYMWNIYDDGGSKVTREYMNELERQSKVMLYGAHYHQEKMMEGIELDPRYNSEILQGITESSANIGGMNSRLRISPEAAHKSKIPADIQDDGMQKSIRYEYVGETTTPFFEISGTDAKANFERTDDFIKKLRDILIDSQGKSSYKFSAKIEHTTKEQVEAERARIYKYIVLSSKKAQKKYIHKPGGYGFVQGVSQLPTNVGRIGTNISTSIGESLLGIESLPSDKSELPTLGSEILDRIPNVTISRIPKINMGDLDPLTFGMDPDSQTQQYKKMISAVTKIKDIESMFGNGAGYVGELITEEAVTHKEDMAELLKDVQVKSFGKQDAYTQVFQPEALSALAKASSVDFFSEKKKLGQAFPTFKLYFVEEDEFESRFLNLDDFYSFNGVKSFTVTRSRDNPGDTAVIALQNVAGTLDGTKRGAIVDLDYFSEKRTKRIEREAKGKGEEVTTIADNFNTNPQTDQPFDAVVLRPGMNVQLRCGYSNNPDLLEVLLSGRITDVSITGNDGMEIVVQSFGVELIAQTKRYINENQGLNELTEHDVEDSANKFYTTHQLLGQMMLEPELKHFGRWERGRLFQYGEMQDSSLDFFRYKEAIKPSMFRNISNTFYYVMGSTLAIAAVVLAARAGNISAITRGLTTSGRFLNTAGSVFNPRFLGGLFTYARGAFGRSVSASTYAGRNILRGRLANNVDDAAVAAMQGVDDGAVETARILMQNIQDIFNVFGKSVKFSVKGIGDLGRILKDPGRFFGGRLGYADDFLRTGGQFTDEFVTALTNLKTTLQSTEYGTKAAGFIIKHIDDLLKGIAEGTLTGTQAASKLKAIGTAAENVALFTVSPASPVKNIVLNGYKSLTATEILGFATAELFVAGFASSAIAFKLSVFHAGLGSTKDSFYQSVYEYRDGMKKWMTKELAYFKMRPSDDNLFCPSPMYYMHMLKVEEPGFWASIKYSMLLGLTGIEGEQFDNLLEQWQNQNPMIHLKKVSMEEAIYYLENKTIWDIFYEMTLRHPGYIYAAVPYGKEFRYTMFFGIPSQRYWSKGVSNGYIQRMNLLRENLVNPPDSAAAVKARSKLLYGKGYERLTSRYEDDFGNLPTDPQGGKYKLGRKGILEEVKIQLEKLEDQYGEKYATIIKEADLANRISGGAPINKFFENLDDYGLSQKEFDDFQKANDTNMDTRYQTFESIEKWESTYNKASMNIRFLQDIKDLDFKRDERHLPFVDDDESDFKKLERSDRIKFHSKVVQEYLTGLENRFVPFRRYHQIRSDRDIVRNNISISAARPVNSVNVYYKDLTNASEPKTKSIFMKASSSLSDNELNTANITNYITNVRSHSMALRYGMSSLIYGMKEMYSGEILVLGNPRIKPWDVCFVFDNYNDMAGPIEVKSVTHMFSFETGYLTEIVPNALVFGNETSSLPVMEALKVYLAASLNLEKGSSKTPDEANLQVDGINPEQQAAANKEVEKTINQHNNEAGDGEIKFESPEAFKDMKVGAFTQKMGLVNNPKFNGYNLSFNTAKYMEQRYTGLVEEGIIVDENGKLGFDYSKVIPEEYLQGKDIFNNDGGIGSYLPTIESYADKAVTGTLALHFAKNPTDHIFKGSGLGGFLDFAAVGSAGGGLYSIFGKGKGALGGLLLGAAGLLYAGASYTNATSFKSHIMDKFSASYLLGAPVIFSRLTQEEAVTVIPLVKEGRPLTTVTSNRDPLSIWKNVFGKFINTAQDSFLGAMDNYRETEALGNEFWKHLEKSNKEFGKDPSFRKLKEAGALYKMVRD